MTNDQTVSLAELRAVAAKIFDSLTEQGIESVKLDVDFFWSIPPDELFRMDATPSNFEVGQVTEANRWLRDIARSTDQPVTYSLVWLADTLRAVGLSLNR